MNVKDLIESFNITQQQLADFTGIPRDRIGKWVQKNQSPPKADDLKIITIAEEFFREIGKEKLNNVIEEYQIHNGEVMLIQDASLVHEEESNYETKNNLDLKNSIHKLLNINKNTIDLPGNKSELSMIYKILAIIEHSNQNMEKIADANKMLASTVQTLIVERKTSQRGSMHVKKTDD
jgi:transcriptional regulator with XRE-family HTH domain